MKRYRVRKGSIADKIRNVLSWVIIAVLAIAALALHQYVGISQVQVETEPQESPLCEEAVAVQYNEPLYNVPLESELQYYIQAKAEAYRIDPLLVLAVIDVESEFRADAVSYTGESYGLMQIFPKWHQERMDRLGCTDLFDPYQNVTVGIDYLAELLATGNGTEWALMAYNGGNTYANEMIFEENIVNAYVVCVTEEFQELGGDVKTW